MIWRTTLGWRCDQCGCTYRELRDGACPACTSRLDVFVTGPYDRQAWGGRNRRKISKHVRRRVLARDGFVCQICGSPVDAADLTLDHIVPYSRGGRESVENLRVAHAACNNGRRVVS